MTHICIKWKIKNTHVICGGEKCSHAYILRHATDTLLRVM